MERREKMGATGLEPVTPSMSRKYSNQLSYAPFYFLSQRKWRAESNQAPKIFLMNPAGRGSRTLTPLRTADFKSALSAIPTSRRNSASFIWRRRADLNRCIVVLQTTALATWLRRHQYFAGLFENLRRMLKLGRSTDPCLSRLAIASCFQKIISKTAAPAEQYL